MATVTVGSSSALQQALATAHAGDTIQLSAGTYSGLGFNGLNFSSMVTITSADPNNKAVLTDFGISNSSGLTFTGVDLFANQANGIWAFPIHNSHDITFDAVRIHGSLDGDPTNDEGGIGFWDSANITLKNSELTQLSTAISSGTTSNIQITGNYIHNLRTDGMDLSSVQGVNIANNYITEFHILAGDHSDAIQMWTGSVLPTSNITVTGNVITKGAGNVAPQGIFMDSDPGMITFSNLTISNNFLLGTGYNGIAIGGAPTNLNINSNQIWSLDSGTGWTWLRVLAATGATVTNNTAAEIDLLNQTALTSASNVLNVPTTDAGKNELAAWLQANPSMAWVATGALPTTPTTPPTTPPPTTPPPTTPPSTTPPTAPISVALDPSTDTGVVGDQITKSSVVRIDGMVAESGATVMLMSSGSVIGSAVADSTGAFSVLSTVNLADGAHALTTVAQSVDGLVSTASAPVNVTIDTVAPVSDLINFALARNNKNETVSLGGTASDDHGAVSVAVYRDGALIKTIADPSGAWSYADTTTNNVHTYTVRATDAAGNLSGAAHSLVIGTASNETIKGTSGSDFIWGAGGYDTMTGGGGADTFVFRSTSDAPMPSFLKNGKLVSVESITDFGAGDKLDLTGLGHLTFDGQSTTQHAHAIDWYVSGGNTFVTADVNGDGRSDMMIMLSGNHPLTASDFLIA